MAPKKAGKPAAKATTAVATGTTERRKSHEKKQQQEEQQQQSKIEISKGSKEIDENEVEVIDLEDQTETENNCDDDNDNNDDNKPPKKARKPAAKATATAKTKKRRSSEKKQGREEEEKQLGKEIDKIEVEVIDLDDQTETDNHVDDENKNDNETTCTTMIPTGMLPEYLAEAFGDLYGEDGLAILGKGLGYLSLLASLVRFYADVEEGHAAIAAEEEEEKRPKRKNQQQDDIDHEKQNQQQPFNSRKRQKPFVLVLGLKEEERSALLNILESWGTPSHMLPTMITNESGQGKDRVHLYERGGVLCITSRILIVDLLTNIANPNAIDGMIVAHAEYVEAEKSIEAFILRLYHSRKQPYGSGFIKGISQEPESFMKRFAKVDKILKALHAKRLYLYPRFQHSIRRELELRSPPQVTELHLKLTVLKQDMQAAIVVAVTSCIQQIKQQDHGNKIQWTDEELLVENCVTSSFDRSISRQLENDWHRLRPELKQLIQDLRTLRTLFQQLLISDCVMFRNLLQNLKTTSAKTRHPSLWLLTPAADLLVKRAKERVYVIDCGDTNSNAPEKKNTKGGVGCLVPVLEENPKWKLLKQTLLEIDQEFQRARKKKSRDNKNDNYDDLLNDGPTTVLIMVQDQKMVDTIKTYLVDGKKRGFMLRWLRHLESINDRSRFRAAKSAAAAEAAAASDPTVSSRAKSNDDENNSNINSDLPEEDRLLLGEERRVRCILFGSFATDKKRKQRQQKRHQ